MTTGRRPARLRRFLCVIGLLSIAVAMAPGTGGTARADSPPPEPGVCQGCQPPLANLGGPVLDTASLTITPIYWAPSGASFPSTYTTVINQYITDIAAASGKTDNVYGIMTQYFQQASDGSKQPIKYAITAGTPLTVTDDPSQSASPCNPAAGYTACVAQDQIRAELVNALTANNLPADPQHLYVMMFAPGVQTCEAGACSGSVYCGIHQAFSPTSGSNLIYADQPYPVAGCLSGQAPNGDPNADAQVSVISHELIEAITDPTTPRTWNDSLGNEIGDECNFNFGPPAGSTDPNNAQSTQYNQVINGHYYWTQTEFSNAAYAANGVGKGCVTAGSSTSTTAYRTTAQDQPAEATMDLSDAKVSADGTSTSTATLTVDDGNGEPVSGDHVHFDVNASDATPGTCGTLKPADGVTDDNGQVTATYTSSTDNIACIIIGIDAESGSSDWATVYQGTAADNEPAITDSTVPGSLTPGADAQTFTVTAQNPSKADIADARFDVFLTGDGNSTTGLQANQVHITYSDANTNDSFVNLPLTGETTKDGEIDGYVMSDKAETLAAGQSETVTFKISIDSGAPTSSTTGSPLHLETDLDQYNPADDSTDNLDYVGPADVTVNGSAASGGLPLAVLIIIVVVAVAIIGGGAALLLRRQRRTPRAA